MRLPRIDLARGGRLALAATAGLMTLWCLTAATCRHMDRSELAGLVGRYEAAATPPAEDGKKSKGDPKKDPAAVAAAERMKRICDSSLFVPPKPPAGFSAALTGVLGDEAFFAGQNSGQKVGQEFNGAKIVEIGPDWVKVSYKGKDMKLEVFGKGGGGPSPGGPRGPMPPGPPGMMPPAGPTPPGSTRIVLPGGMDGPPGATTAPVAFRVFRGGRGAPVESFSTPTSAPAD